MEQKLRNPQIINGEMQPRNFFIGRESCRRLGEMIIAFKEEGINLMAIPMIREVEQGILNDDLEPGTVIGVSPPISEHDLINVLIWDGYSIVAISFLNFHRKQQAGWVSGKTPQPIIENIHQEKKVKKKKKRTTPKHEAKRIRKARNGRRV